MLEKYEIKDSIELILEEDYIVLRPNKIPRQGWEEAFKKLHETGQDQLLVKDIFEDEDFEEWSSINYKIVLTVLDPTVGSERKKTRACVIISPDEMNRHLQTIVIAPMTTKSRNIPTRIKVQ